MTNPNTDGADRPTPEVLRYISRELDAGKNTLRKVVLDAADQIERMAGGFNQLLQTAQELQVSNGELETQIAQRDETIRVLTEELQRVNEDRDSASNETLSAPPVIDEESGRVFRAPETAPEGNVEMNPEDVLMATHSLTEVRQFINDTMRELDALDISDAEKQRRMNAAVATRFGGPAE